MEEIGKALKTIFDKLSDFFDIFDLSFFVSGVATTLSIVFWLNIREIFIISSINFDGFFIVEILICYISGLVSFAAGRFIRMGFGGWLSSKFGKKIKRNDSFDSKLLCIIKAHGLEENPIFQSYLLRTEFRGTWRLYVRLWAVLRGNPKYSQSISLLRRYWVMAATYDGLSISIMIIIFMFLDLLIGITGAPFSINPYLSIIFILSLIFFFFACLREANRYVLYQIEEVIGTIAAGEK
jgi:hypothetical protein